MEKLLKFLSHPLIVALIVFILIALGALVINKINPEYYKNAENFNGLVEWIFTGPIIAGVITWIFKS